MQNIKSIAIILGLVLLILFPYRSVAQPNVAVDYGLFRYDSSAAYVEIYYSIQTASLKFQKQDEKLHVQAMVNCRITKDDTLEWKSDSWRMEQFFDDSSQLEQKNQLVDVINYVMEPGEFKIAVYVEDLSDPNNRGEISRELSVHAFPSRQAALSNIQFASSINKVPAENQDVFNKNGLEVIPVPSGIFGKGVPMLFYYLEAYNLNNAVPTDVYRTRCGVSDINGQPLSSMKPRNQVKKKVDSSVEVGAVNISSLPSGAYSFYFEVLNEKDELIQSNSKKFYVYNPDIESSPASTIEDLAVAVKKSEYASMNEKELDYEFEMAQYIASQDEQSLYKNLKDTDSKSRFIYEFWQKRDPTTATRENELKKMYHERIEYANENYKSFSRKGWKTDRGRIYILYGEPNDIETYPNNALSYSYQIWNYYELEGGVIFVFADLQEFGEFMQLHSSKRGEPKNENWQNVIEKN